MDSLDMETGTVHGQSHHSSLISFSCYYVSACMATEKKKYIYFIFWISVLKDTKDWSVILHLAFQSIGIVYGDIGTSPLYMYASTFTDGVKDNDDILGVLSLIFYTLTLTLIPLFKYVLIVLKANDNGDGESSSSLMTFDFKWHESYFDLLFLSFLFLFGFLLWLEPIIISY